MHTHSSPFRFLFLAAALITIILATAPSAHASGTVGVGGESLRSRVAVAMDGMTLEEKVGQTFLVFFKGPVLTPQLAEMIGRFRVGGILVYDSAGNVQSMEQLAKLMHDAQSLAMSGKRGIGLFTAIDQEGGPVARLRDGFAATPPNMAIGATGDAKNAALAARITARQLSALGINMNLAPVVDVNSNPDNPIIGVRSYGSDPAMVSAFGTAAIEAYEDENVIACAKHFPGHGDTGFDSHVRLPTVPHSLERLNAVEFPPFLAAIKAGVPAVMTAHVEMPAVEPESSLPATMSHKVITGLLREKFGFKGLIISDSLGMGAIAKRYGPGEAAVNAFKAGVDMLCFGADKGHDPQEQRRAFLRMVQAVRQGEISAERLDESVRRILAVKIAYGLMGSEAPRPNLAKVNTETDRKEVVRLAEAGITQIKNEGSVLPLRPFEETLLVWPGARPVPMDELTTLNPLMETVRPSENPTLEERSRIVERAAAMKKIIVLTRRAGRNPGQAALVNELLAAGLGDRLATVTLDVPYDFRLFPEAPTQLAAWSNTRLSIRALGRVLFGRAEPGGKLPVAIPGITD